MRLKASVQRPDETALRATYAREAPHRPHWPRTYEAAAADPLTAAILRTLAAHPPTFGRRRLEPIPAPRGRVWMSAEPLPREIDFKSRAAGEKPEPDENP